MSLTREQIEQLREGMKPYLETHGWVNHDVRQDVDALCDLALTALSPGWRPLTELPKDAEPVLLAVQGTAGAKWVLRAFWAAKFSVEMGDDDADGATEYSEEKDEYFLAEGWYEHNECEETHWKVSDWMKPLGWMPLPSPPKS